LLRNAEGLEKPGIDIVRTIVFAGIAHPTHKHFESCMRHVLSLLSLSASGPRGRPSLSLLDVVAGSKAAACEAAAGKVSAFRFRGARIIDAAETGIFGPVFAVAAVAPAPEASFCLLASADCGFLPGLLSWPLVAS
jgi:hypothetical protein